MMIETVLSKQRTRQVECTYGIVTDLIRWYFLECTKVKDRGGHEKVRFRLSKPTMVPWGEACAKECVRGVMEAIAGVMKSAVKLVESPDDGNEDGEKKRKREIVDVGGGSKDVVMDE